jgi:hypothetical protein
VRGYRSRPAACTACRDRTGHRPAAGCDSPTWQRVHQLSVRVAAIEAKLGGVGRQCQRDEPDVRSWLPTGVCPMGPAPGSRSSRVASRRHPCSACRLAPQSAMVMLTKPITVCELVAAVQHRIWPSPHKLLCFAGRRGDIDRVAGAPTSRATRQSFPDTAPSCRRPTSARPMGRRTKGPAAGRSPRRRRSARFRGRRSC